MTGKYNLFHNRFRLDYKNAGRCMYCGILWYVVLMFFLTFIVCTRFTITINIIIMTMSMYTRKVHVVDNNNKEYNIIIIKHNKTVGQQYALYIHTKGRNAFI